MMLGKFKSRKFLMALASLLFVVLTDVMGLQVPEDVYYSVVALAVSYIAGEAYVDAKRAATNDTQDP